MCSALASLVPRLKKRQGAFFGPVWFFCGLCGPLYTCESPYQPTIGWAKWRGLWILSGTRLLPKACSFFLSFSSRKEGKLHASVKSAVRTARRARKSKESRFCLQVPRKVRFSLKGVSLKQGKEEDYFLNQDGFLFSYWETQIFLKWIQIWNLKFEISVSEASEKKMMMMMMMMMGFVAGSTWCREARK